MNKSIILILLAALFLVTCQPKEQHLLIETELGDMKVMLYNSTPKHRDNIVKLVKEGFYDDLLFHRVIKDFMIQGGDPDSRNANPQQMLGQGGPGYQIDAEIGAYHFKGALSAARMADQVNPERKSSGSQFFIVQGYKVK
jgi:cyclophilin family peptidyl-prolyl cis-trans isomerase